MSCMLNGYIIIYTVFPVFTRNGYLQKVSILSLSLHYTVSTSLPGCNVMYCVLDIYYLEVVGRQNDLSDDSRATCPGILHTLTIYTRCILN